MAFFADVYGFIVVKGNSSIPLALIEDISLTTPGFKPCFSDSVKTRNASYISFASSVKIDDVEDDLWLRPFELLLNQIDFLSATVHIDHEETQNMMMYTYFKNGDIKKLSIQLSEQCLEERTLSSV
ncbi:hypothetical protein ACO0LC_20070 [Undibacterium sp. JH2W]|uniref:hypothetical protein n=1 Tax=Undibacterium sp. JH2W TaxID=3413037 RepID=UPI003BF15C83